MARDMPRETARARHRSADSPRVMNAAFGFNSEIMLIQVLNPEFIYR